MSEIKDSVVSLIFGYEVPRRSLKEHLWKSIERQIRMESDIKREKNHAGLRIYIAAGVAAGLLILAVFIYIFRLQMEARVFKTDAGERTSVFLPDSSKVILNAGSYLRFDPGKWNQTRIVFMKGEAFFSVKKGNTFIVKTLMGNVQVLGTEFNLLVRNSNYEVSCFKGSVLVTSKTKNGSVKLKKGEAARYIKNGRFSTPKPFDSERVASWRNERLYFVNVPLEEVLIAFEKHYHVEFMKKNFPGRKYTGSFPCHDMEMALDLICTPMNLKYKRIGKSTIAIEAN